jgi:hypothetical protein
MTRPDDQARETARMTTPARSGCNPNSSAIIMPLVYKGPLMDKELARIVLSEALRPDRALVSGPSLPLHSIDEKELPPCRAYRPTD